MAQYRLKQFKSVLIIRKSTDAWFWDKYGINPYNGCEHGCIYCDSRSSKYYLPTDFENDIIVKENIGSMLESRIKKARTLLPDIVAMAGASDPYHAAESRYNNTQQCLHILNKYGFPVHILTKSKLVLRDMDILQDIGEKTWSCVSVTITTSDPDLARFLEPKAPSPDQRFEIIRKIKKTSPDIQSGVLLMPIIPFLGDAPWQLEDVIKTAKDSGADYVLFGAGMTMRNVQALWFLKHLKRKFPSLIPKYEQLYQFRYDPENYYGNYVTTGSYYQQINETLLNLCHKHNMPFRIKRYIPGDYRGVNYLIAEKLLNEAYENQILNTADKDLFWTGLNIQRLKESITGIYQKGELSKIPNMNLRIRNKISEILKSINQLPNENKQLNLFQD